MPEKPSPLLLSAFVSASVENVIHGTWRQPESEQIKYNSIDYWVDLAKLLERGKFDLMFFADVIGIQGPHRGDFRKTAESSIHFPVNDPSTLAPVLAYVTENLGIAFTSSTLQEHPFNFARRISTLDHISGGRVAWNIVTGAIENAAHNFGFAELTPHDQRYVWADEYVDVVYKLWEGSWDEGALLQDRARGVHVEYEKIHQIDHEGPRYRVRGPHLSSPSPQRTPFLFQAGSSPAGRDFAARNAEAIFFATANLESVREQVSDTRRRAESFGRLASDLKFFLGLHFVIGDTEAEALRKSDELDEWIDYDAQLANLGGALNIDFGLYDLDTPIPEIQSEGVRGVASLITQSVSDRVPVVRDVARVITQDGRVVGTPEQIADHLERLRDIGVDGINVFNTTRPGSYVEFIEYLTPVLQKRGLVKDEYEPGTLRNKIFGHDRLPDRHPATRYRGAFTSMITRP
jgi:FMN-dependent oxidoreductase (nitrilotriacetate monooxygenase family)